jgi:hypothetical protein
MWQESRIWMARFGFALVVAFMACSLTPGQDACGRCQEGR